ncbi:uncharacterized protein B0T23DRAFT_52943 [Neurospora hispaniola]|uniref:Uncharacterized protein n=1 Tax=Neurospora hispaniola TaxID=588809 RepID=A0AAJ0HYJ7_9PEZI|nr:hypothetical protein B0T23DRAFT_52943 [Neurospora hispaniola]
MLWSLKSLIAPLSRLFPFRVVKAGGDPDFSPISTQTKTFETCLRTPVDLGGPLQSGHKYPMVRVLEPSPSQGESSSGTVTVSGGCAAYIGRCEHSGY